MKKLFLFAGLIVSNPLSSVCPKEYTEVEVGPLYMVAKTACPSSYTEITNVLVLPAGGVCDAIKGNCSTAGVCQVP